MRGLYCLVRRPAECLESSGRSAPRIIKCRRAERVKRRATRCRLREYAYVHGALPRHAAHLFGSNRDACTCDQRHKKALKAKFSTRNFAPKTRAPSRSLCCLALATRAVWQGTASLTKPPRGLSAVIHTSRQFAHGLAFATQYSPALLTMQPATSMSACEQARTCLHSNEKIPGRTTEESRLEDALPLKERVPARRSFCNANRRDMKATI